MGIECPIEKDDLYIDKLFVYADRHSDLKSFLDFIDEDMEALDRGGNAIRGVQRGIPRQRHASYAGQAWYEERTGVCVRRQQQRSGNV